jgi:hypothetical protein
MAPRSKKHQHTDVIGYFGDAVEHLVPIKVFLKVRMLEKKRLLADDARVLKAVIGKQWVAATQHNYHNNLRELCHNRPREK